MGAGATVHFHAIPSVRFYESKTSGDTIRFVMASEGDVHVSIGVKTPGEHRDLALTFRRLANELDDAARRIEEETPAVTA